MLVEDYSHVAVIELLSVLRKMREHCGSEFQITSKTINKTLQYELVDREKTHEEGRTLGVNLWISLVQNLQICFKYLNLLLIDIDIGFIDVDRGFKDVLEKISKVQVFYLS